MKKYLWKIKMFLLMDVLSYGMIAVTVSLMVYVQKLLFDDMESGGASNIWMYIGLLTLCVIFFSLFNYTFMIATFKCLMYFERDLRRDFFAKITRFDAEKFRSRKIGEYISIQGNDIRTLSTVYLSAVTGSVSAVVMFIIYGVGMFLYVDWKMALIIFGMAFLSAAVLPKFTEKKLHKSNKKYLDHVGECTAKTSDLLGGFKLIDKRTRENFRRTFNRFTQKNAKIEFLFKKAEATAGMFNLFSEYAIKGIAFMISIYLIYNGTETIGTAVAAMNLVVLFTEPIEAIIYCINSFKSIKGIKEKLEDILQFETPTLEEKVEFEREIEFENVSIKYENFSMESLSFRFQKGKKYAIVGESGSGKSSFIKALTKDKEIDAGRILIDGMDIKEIDTSNIISCINQDEHIFSAGFNDNITCFESYPSSKLGHIRNIFAKEVMDSIQKNQNSAALSGGQKGIIKFIRSCIEEKEICIFDELFAGIDIETMNKLKRYLLKTDKTIIMITHRLADDLDGFDEIIELKDGCLNTRRMAV